MTHETHPAWYTESFARYTGTHQELHPMELHTNPLHGRVAAKIITERLIKPHLKEELHICVVGLGFNAQYVCQPIEPYVISAAIEQQGQQYKLTLVDKSKDVLRDVISRRNIYLHENLYHDNLLLWWMRSEWDSYLNHTGQSPQITHEQMSDLHFRTDLHFDPKTLLKEGFQIANIPSGLKQKLESGKGITLIEADIATIDPDVLKNPDFIACSNVLYYLPVDGQKIALWNMAQASNRMLISDILPRDTVPTLARYGGWLSPEVAYKEYGLQLEVVDEDSRYQSVLLTRL